jgi:four helix bundle protein
MKLAEEIYRVTARFPRDEIYGLVSQIRRAAVSIPSNLAEGYGRGGNDYARFVGMGYGSLLELETQLELAKRLAFLSEDDASQLSQLTSELGRMLNGLRRSVRKTQPEP